MVDHPIRGFFGYFLRSHRVTFLLILALAGVGISTALNLPRESTPEIDIPFGVVVTAYPGASSRDVEELVTKPIEEVLENLSDVVEITSTSRLGFSSVGIEFEAGRNLAEARRRLREAVDGVTALPEEATTPEVIELDFNTEPIITIGLGGLDDIRLLTLYAEKLANDIAEISGVSDVNVIGSLEEEISVALDVRRLADLRLTMGQVIDAIAAANQNAPLGHVETDGFNYDLRLTSRFTNVGDIAAVPITLPAGDSIPLAQLASVRQQVPKATKSARVSVAGAVSTPSVSLNVVKKAEGKVDSIASEVRLVVSAAEETYLPNDIVVEAFADQSEEVRRSISDVAKSGLQTLLIVFIILLVFLGWQEAIIAAVSIPLTFFISFIIFDLTGTTLNGISMFSLILSLGLLVDNAIVITEGIHEKPEAVSLRQHAHNVVNTFKKPLVGGTLTTVAAFFPMLLVSGIIGQFLKTIPIVVGSTLIASLFVALALIPPVAVTTLTRLKKTKKQPVVDRYFSRFAAWYDHVITHLLSNRRLQNRFIAVMVVLLVIGLSLPFTGLLKTALFPTVDIDFMLINVELPPGSKLAVTEQVMERVEATLHGFSEIESLNANIGSSTSVDLGGGASSENLGSFFVNLAKDRQRSSIVVTEELRAIFDGPTFTDAKVEVSEISAGPPTAPPVEVRVVGPELAELDLLSQQIMDELATIEGAIDINRDLHASAGEFNFVLKQEHLADHGLTNADVSQFLRTSIFGVEATSFLDTFGEEIEVEVSAPKALVASVPEIISLPIVNRAGQEVVLGTVADVDLETSFNAIRRRNGERTVTVNANTAAGFNANAIAQETMQRMAGNPVPEGYRVEFGGEQEETVETFNELYRSMFISVILILIILVIEFNSYRQPLVIFLSVPLALIGVLFGLLLTGSALSFAAFIGLVSLTGIVVNDAIIIVDRMNHLLIEGKELLSAVREGAKSRLQPVILTTLTTAGGVAPLIFVDEFFRDVAITIMTGLIFASVLTLVFVPILYLRQQQKLTHPAA